MQKRKKVKSIVISVTAVVAAAALGLGLWSHFRKSNVAPVKVYDFYSVGMDSYWGDSKETYGPVSTDRIQTVFLSSTQTVSEVLVKEGDTVKKGDVLMRFDTTLNDLSLERKRLEVEKLKVDLQNAYDRLAEINNMKPMVIPDPTQPTEPVPPDQGTPISGHYQLLGGNQAVGTAENPLICWLNSSVGIEDTLLGQLRQAAQERQAALIPTQPTEATEAPAAQAAEDASALLRRLLRGGVPAQHALGCLHAQLTLGSRAGAVTVDLAEIRLDTGQVSLYKWGAAPSYLIRRGRAEKIGTAAPPPGFGETRETAARLSLCRGEVLVLISDGVELGQAPAWAEQASQMPAGELAERILRQSAGEDDATAAVIRLLPTSVVP